MDTVVVPFSPKYLPAVQRFSELHWSRPRTTAYYRWRYLDSGPFSKMFLALRGNECLGTLFALRKRYLVAGRETPCLEVFDWHSLPEQRGTGVGVRLMRAMMRQPERVISVGGTPIVHSALPAMGWQRLPSARMFELKTSTDALADALRRRISLPSSTTRVPLGLLARTWFRPRRRKPPSRGLALAVAMVGDEVGQLYEGNTGYGLLQVPDRDVVRWFTSGYPGSGSFGFLYFVIDGHLRGWSMTRVYETQRGREASILELFAPSPDTALYTWMVSEAASSILGFDPRVIRALASCPILQAALRRNRFVETSEDTPVMTWPTGLTDRLGPVHVTLNHSDEPLRPYPSPHAASALFV